MLYSTCSSGGISLMVKMPFAFSVDEYADNAYVYLSR
jgi:hypothetical protein